MGHDVMTLPYYTKSMHKSLKTQLFTENTFTQWPTLGYKLVDMGTITSSSRCHYLAEG